MSPSGESQRQFGRRIGLSQGRVSQLVKDGLPVLANGRIDVEAAVRWLEDNLDHQRSARAKQGAAAVHGSNETRPTKPEVHPSAPAFTAPPPVSAPTSAANASMAEVRRQHELLKVARARLRLETEKGRLVNRDEVKLTIFTRARRERNCHLAWALRVAPQMAAELAIDPAVMFSTLDHYLRDHLSDLAKTPLFNLPE